MHIRQAGFNVIELMVTLFVATIVLSVGVPAFSGFSANNRIATASNDLASSLHLARTEAIKRRAAVTICPSDDWSANSPSCSNSDFEDGWIIFMDALAPALPDLAHTGAVDVLFAHGPMAQGVGITLASANSVLASQPFLSYQSNGFPVTRLAGNDAVFNFQVCDKRGNVDVGGGIAAGRWIQVAPTGRPQIYREVSQVQATANPTTGC